MIPVASLLPICDSHLRASFAAPAAQKPGAKTPQIVVRIQVSENAGYPLVIKHGNGEILYKWSCKAGKIIHTLW